MRFWLSSLNSSQPTSQWCFLVLCSHDNYVLYNKIHEYGQRFRSQQDAAQESPLVEGPRVGNLLLSSPNAFRSLESMTEKAMVDSEHSHLEDNLRLKGIEHYSLLSK